MTDAPDIFPYLSYSRVTERIILGSRPKTLDDIRKLRTESVSHILDVDLIDDARLLPPGISGDAPISGVGCEWADYGIVGYRFNPTADDGQPKPASWFLDSLHFAMPILAKPGWVLYVHCESGMDRSAATVYAILCAWGLGKIRAWEMIKLARPEALWRYTGDADVALRRGW